MKINEMLPSYIGIHTHYLNFMQIYVFLKHFILYGNLYTNYIRNKIILQVSIYLKYFMITIMGKRTTKDSQTFSFLFITLILFLFPPSLTHLPPLCLFHLELQYIYLDIFSLFLSYSITIKTTTLCPYGQGGVLMDYGVQHPSLTSIQTPYPLSSCSTWMKRFFHGEKHILPLIVFLDYIQLNHFLIS